MGGRRTSGGRRPGENFRAFVDRYSLRLWVLLTLVLALNALDSHFTLLYLARGGEEGNPVAAFLLGSGLETFLGAKAIGLGLGIALFGILKNFPNGRRGLLAIFGIYSLLLLWHLILFFRLLYFEHSV